VEQSYRSVTAGPTSTRLRVQSGPERDYFWDSVDTGRWEPETLDAIHQIVSPGDRVIDVGAWVGVTALYAASLGGEVLAYEPDPRALAEMQASLGLNDGLSVSIQAVALGVEPGVALLRSRSLGDSMSSLVRSGRLTDSVEVECRGVEREVRERQFAQARLVKVDVEGYEFQLVPAMMCALRSRGFQGDLLLSTHAYPTVESVMNRLRADRLIQRRCYRWINRGVMHGAVPILMLRRNVRLLWSIRGASSAHVSRRSGGNWKRFSLGQRLLFVMQPRDRELWLQWR
jgi:FkbM family methyltransferase